MAEAFQSDAVPEWLSPRFNIAPSQSIAAVRVDQGSRRWVSLKWGLVPSWSKQASLRYSTINARAETVAEKPTYRKPFQHSRCLIPADGFYEWKTENKAKQPYYIHRKDDAPFAFAGLWDRWQRGDQIIDSATIIVTRANSVMAPIHPRMPVIIAPEDYGLWLDHEQFDRDRLEALLQPCPDTDLQAYPVSRLVNSPANDEAACIEPQKDLFV